MSVNPDLPSHPILPWYLGVCSLGLCVYFCFVNKIVLLKIAGMGWRGRGGIRTVKRESNTILGNKAWNLLSVWNGSLLGQNFVSYG